MIRLGPYKQGNHSLAGFDNIFILSKGLLYNPMPPKEDFLTKARVRV